MKSKQKKDQYRLKRSTFDGEDMIDNNKLHPNVLIL